MFTFLTQILTQNLRGLFWYCFCENYKSILTVTYCSTNPVGRFTVDLTVCMRKFTSTYLLLTFASTTKQLVTFHVRSQALHYDDRFSFYSNHVLGISTQEPHNVYTLRHKCDDTRDIKSKWTIYKIRSVLESASHDTEPLSNGMSF